MAISATEANVRLQCPDYRTMLAKLITASSTGEDLTEEDLPEEVVELLHEWFDTAEEQNMTESDESKAEAESNGSEPDIETIATERAEWEKTVANLQVTLEEAKRAKDKEKQKKLRAQIREAEKKLAGV